MPQAESMDMLMEDTSMIKAVNDGYFEASFLKHTTTSDPQEESKSAVPNQA